MPAQQRLAAIHAARSGDGIVFLDLDQDSYSCIYHRENDEWNVAEALPCPAGTITLPRQTGDRPSPQWREADIDEPVLWSFSDIILFVRALASALMSFPGKDVRTLFKKIDATRSGLRRDRPEQTALVADRFERLWLFVPFRGKCLFRSFVLLRYLHLHGLGADWIFGVSLFPFSAHCWLALDDLLIGEKAHRICQYETIFSFSSAEA